ncbi:diguanylate cyclase [Saccharobesus litoralis]|uniref:diguanylate cyclase n=1 Tax=Saccharobesus litoralis TaxID=2172099 RepID=UPI00131F3F81|nr:diguanylate cyclase [Saccharobesus litoralis]
MSKTTSSICLKEIDDVVTEARKGKYIQDGIIDVQWASAGSHASQYTLPITKPIFLGLTGMRVFVIRKGEQARFDKINTLHDLRGLKAGQGLFWGDTKVLQAAGLPVTTSAQARRLWHMLYLKRFDYLPLGVHEPWKDLAMRQDLELEVERNLLLVYPSGLYFYVNQQNKSLYQLITDGFDKALADGSYQAKLRQSNMIQSVLKYANLEQRRVIYLANPLVASTDKAGNNEFTLPRFLQSAQ